MLGEERLVPEPRRNSWVLEEDDNKKGEPSVSGRHARDWTLPFEAGHAEVGRSWPRHAEPPPRDTQEVGQQASVYPAGVALFTVGSRTS
jgi:hypothetical protein